MIRIGRHLYFVALETYACILLTSNPHDSLILLHRVGHVVSVDVIRSSYCFLSTGATRDLPNRCAWKPNDRNGDFSRGSR